METVRHLQTTQKPCSKVSASNPIILCVPLDKDTVWWECTNQNITFGYLPISSQGRYALLIKSSGGELVKTSSFRGNANTRISSIDFNLNEVGDVDF